MGAMSTDEEENCLERPASLEVEARDDDEVDRKGSLVEGLLSASVKTRGWMEEADCLRIRQGPNDMSLEGRSRGSRSLFNKEWQVPVLNQMFVLRPATEKKIGE